MKQLFLSLFILLSSPQFASANDQTVSEREQAVSLIEARKGGLEWIVSYYEQRARGFEQLASERAEQLASERAEQLAGIHHSRGYYKGRIRNAEQRASEYKQLAFEYREKLDLSLPLFILPQLVIATEEGGSELEWIVSYYEQRARGFFEQFASEFEQIASDYREIASSWRCRWRCERARQQEGYFEEMIRNAEQLASEYREKRLSSSD